MRYILSVFTLTAALAGCITYTPETRAIRQVSHLSDVAGCTALGAVAHESIMDAVEANFVGSGKGFTDVLNQAAAMHADTVLITDPVRVAGTAYKCGSGMAGTAVPVTAPPAPSNAPSAASASHTPAPTVVPSATATAASVTGTPAAMQPNAAAGNTSDRLTKLDGLYKSGLITKDEYDRKRQEILSAL